MMKYIMFGIKMIPIITILQGVISGGSRMGPFVDTIKVALTQYEIAQISRSVVEARGPMVTPEKFSVFIRDHYYSQYSVLARELKGDKDHDHAIDIWGKPFLLVPIEGTGNLLVMSSGPDGLLNNKDDLSVTLEGSQENRLAAAAAKKQKQLAQERPVENQPIGNEEQLAAESNLAQGEELREPADSGDFDEEGYDQEGYDQSGFSREGYNRDGHDVDGNQKPEEI